MLGKIRYKKFKLYPQHVFMLSALVVNGGNYLYNLVLGRVLGPEKFADAAIIITFMMVLSFLAMTFQLVPAKYSIIFSKDDFNAFMISVYKSALKVSITVGACIVFFSKELQEVFKTSTSSMFVILGIGVPFYFIMSVNRGVFQGTKKLISLSATYQLEMISRIVITFSLLYFLNLDSSMLISLGVFGSFIFGMIPFRFNYGSFKKRIRLTSDQRKSIRVFFTITLFYELTQIIINNSDILLVKYFFSSYNAGLYASLALIGRVVYFIAWMFVMILLPTVVRLKKLGRPTRPILFKYVGYIGGLTAFIILSCFLFPEQAILLLFGEGYLEVNSLLWKYALATGVFTISNIFTYYYLSIDTYLPVFFSGIFGLIQIVGIIQFHSSIEEVIMVQVCVMTLLLILQLLYFFFNEKKERKVKTTDNSHLS